MPAEQLEQFIDNTEQKLDEVVVTGSDEELFISGYFHGHFSLVVSQVLGHEVPTMALLDELLLTSLSNAFANNELEPQDQAKVLSLWQSLKIQ
ncbi:YfcL family protein [Aliiglaciecola sp. LCG003]|uniref:YfcL family protein n=1 Tax=Aliiglaciecola sp. LCG003 TaxID=3053655 RepID=UPI002572ADAB|nr:YfcL family protein [Aliiglaciecola sp. LCG003]WJG08302.1 YfcL family protein [Aliiglaciecola sp. LCG003]